MTIIEQLNTFLTLSLPDPESSEVVRAVRSEAITACRRAEQVVTYTHTQIPTPNHTIFCVQQSSEMSALEGTLKEFSPSDGPFFRSLDESLQQLNQWCHICRKLHKLLQV